jgi:hypothetical protein
MVYRAGQGDLQHADAHQRVDATGKIYYRRARLEAWHAQAEISTIARVSRSAMAGWWRHSREQPVQAMEDGSDEVLHLR